MVSTLLIFLLSCGVLLLSLRFNLQWNQIIFNIVLKQRVFQIDAVKLGWDGRSIPDLSPKIRVLKELDKLRNKCYMGA